MIATILLFGVLAGLDNLQVCSSLGLLPMSTARRRNLAAAFSLCETGAPLAGLLVGHAVLSLMGAYADVLGPAMTICCGLAVLVAALRGEPDNEGAGGRLLFGLPLSLSLDNVAAGLGISALNCPVWLAALAIGLISAGMSCIGLYGASAIRKWMGRAMPARTGVAVGGYLCVLAVRMLVAKS
jgi:putative Mn2+ efflux pump MntP